MPQTLTFQTDPHSGQSFARPPDVQPYVDQNPTYAAGTDLNVLGDGTQGTPLGSDGRGGAMPVAELTEVVEPDYSSWLIASPQFDASGFEDKFRTLGNWSRSLKADPIRHYGQPGSGHWHEFLGSSTINAWSTYESNRRRAQDMSNQGMVASTFPGGPINGTPYWVPTIFDGNGDPVRPFLAVVYYTQNPASRSPLTNKIPRGLRYITGCNGDDPLDERVQQEIATANAQAGTAGRYTYQGNGFQGWYMHNEVPGSVIGPQINTSGGGNSSPFFRDLVGTDPWAGAADSPGLIKADLAAPEAFDGTNLWSTGGFWHFRHLIGDNMAPAPFTSETWPQGWFVLPRLVLSIWYRHTGWASDVSNWTVAGHNHFETNAGQNLEPGRTMHNDWLDGWSELHMRDTANGWQSQCTNAGPGGTGRECNSSTFNSTHRFVGGFTADNAPDGTRTPQFNIDPMVDPGRGTLPVGEGQGPFTLG